MKKLVRGSIFYADLKGSLGSEQDGIRPVLVIQNNTSNKFSPTTIIASITTKNENILPTHVLIKSFDKMKYDSIIMLEQIRTIDKSRLRGFVCSLKPEQLVEVDRALVMSLNINVKQLI